MSKKKCLTCFLLLIIPVILAEESAQGAYQLEYTIEVYKDGSALWIIEQRGMDLQPVLDRFVKNVSQLIKASKSLSERSMSAENFFMKVRVSGSYKVIRYGFLWNGFGLVNDSRIEIGDVFLVENFFEYFYGDGTVYIRYPDGYLVEEVYPQPGERYESPPTLKWYGVKDFKAGQPKIVIKEKSSTFGILSFLAEYTVLIVGLLIFLTGGLGLYYFRFRKEPIEKVASPTPPKTSKPPLMMDDEEKVLSLLKAAGGSLYQSTIAEQCRFSRAKVSKLLTLMEKEGKIKREKKGREKIVTIKEDASD